eukprot:CAMPEP_0197080798 /NCGR_PEP_ID=MMETSP1384-20130603/214313_1 /TAXON_ID=29189 /ORGANISM="Ammonia sp." /LENGTH=398 /DNA_ID=CAMNT_0042519689 /DNA_START=563 /DNA_END=1759 /DNA_ORIENTATION=+
MVMLFLIVMWYRIPQFDDIWRIRHELILTIRMLVVGLAIFIILALLLNWQPPTWKYAVLSSVATVAAVLQCYAMLYFPLKRFKLPSFVYCAYVASKATLIKERMQASHTQYRKKRPIKMEEKADGQMQVTQFFKLKAILLNKDGFRLFAGHLMKELAIENLLFFVESSQWLEYLIELCHRENIQLSIDEKASGIDVRFNKHCPRSRIVCWSPEDDRLKPVSTNLSNDTDTTLSTNTNTTNNLTRSASHPGAARPSGTLTTTSSGGNNKPRHSTQLTVDLNLDDFEVGAAIDDPWLQCAKIFRKYIVNGSYFCINISGENRIELYEAFGYDASANHIDEEIAESLKENLQNDMDKLFHIFDTARYAVFRLMIYSVSRFETSDTYLEHFVPIEEQADSQA